MSASSSDRPQHLRQTRQPHRPLVTGIGWRGAAAAATAVAALATGCSAPPAAPAPTASVSTASSASPVTAPSRPRIPSAAASGAHDHAVDLGEHSTTDPTSIWVVVNKQHPLTPLRFAPDLVIVDQHLVAAAVEADLTALLAAAEADGVPLHLASTYRSYGYQAQVHQHLVDTDGHAAADRYSARPGYSEHQTGLAVDVTGVGDASCNLEACFASTPAGRWVHDHAARFGFILRYTAAERDVTGYDAEPWHLRYVGQPLAGQMQRDHIGTLEQVFGISGGDYS